MRIKEELLENLEKIEKIIEGEKKSINEKQNSADEIKKEIEQIKQIERNDLNQLILSNVDVLLKLVPKHNKTNCSDSNLNVEWSGCTRCDLLYLKKSRWIDCDIKMIIGFVNQPVNWKYD